MLEYLKFLTWRLHGFTANHVIAKHPNQVNTTDYIASLVETEWPQALTAVNIMTGFKKCKIYPGEVTDHAAYNVVIAHAGPQEEGSRILRSNSNVL